ncbi:hypothetical protein GcC1_180052 [Golovinomyces cichoracearum]|uniref:Uncharacterized protein n=1 Tax=Golovinomyces cichoracearum TaxID=62708 RepID=A0A420HMV7_9PEZI|nr:hypothetical protein GcC1_180052 [Golovinomyces cichoracearum]
MKRSPPKVRDSAVGLTDLSQVQREKSENVDPFAAGQSSLLSELNERHTSDNRSHGDKLANFTLRSRNAEMTEQRKENAELRKEIEHIK